MTQSSQSPVGSTTADAAGRRRGRSATYREQEGRLAPLEGIARALIIQRAALGLSQRDVAERIGTSVAAISRLESGTHEPNLRTLRRVADALDMEITVQPRSAARLLQPSELISDPHTATAHN